jgi:hypothetical protein
MLNRNATKNWRIPVSFLKAQLAGCFRLRVFLLLTLIWSGVCGRAEDSFADRAEREFRTWLDAFLTDSSNPEVAWKFARACFDWAEHAPSSSQREKVAEQGIEASRRALALEPGLAAGHYYLALNLGQLARTRTLTALRLVKEMERELKAAREADPLFDFAGPDRSLGLLYRDAPGWPASIGSRRNARRQLERAVALSPESPDNRLYLIETYLKYQEFAAARREMAALDKVMVQAREKFTGEEWESSWADWEERRERLKKEMGARSR